MASKSGTPMPIPTPIPTFAPDVSPVLDPEEALLFVLVEADVEVVEVVEVAKSSDFQRIEMPLALIPNTPV